MSDESAAERLAELERRLDEAFNQIDRGVRMIEDALGSYRPKRVPTKPPSWLPPRNQWMQ